MKDYEWELLSFIRDNQPVYWTAVLNNFDPSNNINFYHSALSHMLDKDKYIKLLSPASGRKLSMVCLTPKGAMAFISEKDHRQSLAALSDNRNVDGKQNKGDVPKKRHVEISSIAKFLGSIVDIIKLILEILRLLPL